MKRYHEKVYFPIGSKEKLKAFTGSLNNKKWKYTKHSLDNLKYRYINIEVILAFIFNLKLDSDNIFEFYTNNTGDILKACYRLQYDENMDIILVISDIKNIVTIYSNIRGDNHITLDKNLYVKQ